MWIARNIDWATWWDSVGEGYVEVTFEGGEKLPRPFRLRRPPLPATFPFSISSIIILL